MGPARRELSAILGEEAVTGGDELPAGEGKDPGQGPGPTGKTK